MIGSDEQSNPWRRNNWKNPFFSQRRPVEVRLWNGVRRFCKEPSLMRGSMMAVKWWRPAMDYNQPQSKGVIGSESGNEGLLFGSTKL